MITQQELKQRLHYDLDTGIFTWLTCKQRSGKVPGDVAFAKQHHKQFFRVA